MCGIAGWIDYQKDLRGADRVIKKMVETLIHRGPDADGIWLSAHVALGHRRLIVVDPVGGAQPMIRNYQGRTYVMTYNGELYNTSELRQELVSRGHIFQTHNSDTEALLMAYIEWGEDCLHKLNGIFAFGIWDDTNQSLFLARDRLGVKPLFYRESGSSLLYASEPKALLVHPEVKAQVDREGLAEIFAMGPSRTPGHGLFKEIKELRPGYMLSFGSRGMSIKKYWSLDSQPHEDSPDLTAIKLRCLFADTVKRQLMADRPVCTLLSGGLDSSAISAFAAMNYPDDPASLKTFSVDYIDNQKYYTSNAFETSSDSPWAQKVSQFLGTSHRSVIIDNRELADALNPALLAGDAPGMTDVDSSLYLFCREIKKEATVALSGECADEILGGYPWFYDAESYLKPAFPWIRMLTDRNRFLSEELIQKVQPEEYAVEKYREAVSEVPRLDGEGMADAKIRELFYLNITRFMPTLLDRKDRMSMACSLEVRVPFADHRLVEYIWNIPWEMKNHGGRTKGIFRKALYGILPDEVLDRKKSPYPKTHHPAYANQVKQELLQVLQNSQSPIQPLVKKNEIVRIIQSGEEPFFRPWFSQLMGGTQYMAYLLQVNRWLKEYGVNIVM